MSTLQAFSGVTPFFVTAEFDDSTLLFFSLPTLQGRQTFKWSLAKSVTLLAPTEN